MGKEIKSPNVTEGDYIAVIFSITSDYLLRKSYNLSSIEHRGYSKKKMEPEKKSFKE